MTNQGCHIKDFPSELISDIFSYLSTKDLKHAHVISREAQFQAIAFADKREMFEEFLLLKEDAVWETCMDPINQIDANIEKINWTVHTVRLFVDGYSNLHDIIKLCKDKATRLEICNEDVSRYVFQRIGTALICNTQLSYEECSLYKSFYDWFNVAQYNKCVILEHDYKQYRFLSPVYEFETNIFIDKALEAKDFEILLRYAYRYTAAQVLKIMRVYPNILNNVRKEFFINEDIAYITITSVPSMIRKIQFPDMDLIAHVLDEYPEYFQHLSHLPCDELLKLLHRNPGMIKYATLVPHVIAETFVKLYPRELMFVKVDLLEDETKKQLLRYDASYLRRLGNVPHLVNDILEQDPKNIRHVYKPSYMQCKPLLYMHDGEELYKLMNKPDKQTIEKAVSLYPRLILTMDQPLVSLCEKAIKLDNSLLDELVLNPQTYRRIYNKLRKV